jgi:hypothetical protein
VAAIRLDFGEKQVVLRLPCEPPWPGEEAGLENWLTAEWLPCPKCRAPVVWYEANFVPGYRICTGRKHHHSLVIQEAKK